MSKAPGCSIYVIKSPGSAIAAVFRRGPSKQVQVLKWDMHSDEFTPGQWFKGRIYERRCDLSPSGRYLLYFAAKYKPPHYSWTALSKLPYLTALAMWPKGDGWGGGGLFDEELSIQLNHRITETNLAEGFDPPRELKTRAFEVNSGWGEDDPICRMRMERDGWTLKQEACIEYCGMTQTEWSDYQNKFAAIFQRCDGDYANLKLPESPKPTSPYPDVQPMFAVYNPPEIMCKARDSRVLEMRTLGYHEQNGPTYVVKFRVLDDSGQCLLDLDRADWADWSEQGDLLFAKAGCLYRLANLKSIDDATLLIDLNKSIFKNVVAPGEYQHW